MELGPFKVRLEDPARPPGPAPAASAQDVRAPADPAAAFGPALWVVGGLLFAMSGATLWLSAAGRYRWRVLGLAVFVILVQFLVNLVGQMWEPGPHTRRRHVARLEIDLPIRRRSWS